MRLKIQDHIDPDTMEKYPVITFSHTIEDRESGVFEAVKKLFRDVPDIYEAYEMACKLIIDSDKQKEEISNG